MSQRPILRRCIACRKMLDRRQLLKVTRDHKDGVVLDGGMGRSAYLCLQEDCLEESWRKKRLQKALRCQVPKNLFEVLQKRLNDSIESTVEAR